MQTKKTLSAAATIFSLVFVLGCPHPLPSPGKTAINCGAKAVQDHGLTLIGPVNNCLHDMSYVSCLLNLIQPAAGITEEVIACVVKASETTYGASAKDNPNDFVSLRSFEHARDFVAGRGYIFADYNK